MIGRGSSPADFFIYPMPNSNISICQNHNCSLKKECWRHEYPPRSFGQSYIIVIPKISIEKSEIPFLWFYPLIEEVECEYFIKMPEKTTTPHF